MSRWKITPGILIEGEKNYTAGFACRNIETDAVVHIEFTQTIPGPASDLVGALRALAQTLLIAASGDDNKPESPAKLN